MLHARMLFSCLCDADYLASASHNDEKINQRSEDEPLDTKKILDSLVEYRSNIISSATVKSPALAGTTVESVRAVRDVPLYLSLFDRDPAQIPRA